MTLHELDNLNSEQLVDLELIDFIKQLLPAKAIAFETLHKLAFRMLEQRCKLAVDEEERRRFIQEELSEVREKISDEVSAHWLSRLYEPVRNTYELLPLLAPLMVEQEDCFNEVFSDIDPIQVQHFGQILDAGLYEGGKTNVTAIDKIADKVVNEDEALALMSAAQAQMEPILQLHYQREYVLQLKEFLYPTSTSFTESSVRWKGNGTDFATLIYCLGDAGLLETDSGSTPQMVECMAKLLGYNLSSDWISNFTKSVNSKKPSDAPPILNRLQKGFTKYLSGKIKPLK